MTVSQELKKKAIQLGLCKQWTNDWGKPDLDKLVQMYIIGIDFCIFNNYPSNEYIKQNFGKVAQDHGVFTDTEIDLVNPEIAILNGTTRGRIELNGFVSRDIYIRHKSHVIITVKDAAIAFIRVFDKAKVQIINQTNKKVFVYSYSKSATIDGDVQIREKRLNEL